MAHQHVGNLLHRKRVGRCPRPHPKDVDAGIKCGFHVGFGSHFGRHQHTRFMLDFLQPRQCLVAHALKTAGHGARFPHSGSEGCHTEAFQRPSRGKRLLLGFGAAGAGHNNRLPALAVGKSERPDILECACAHQQALKLMSSDLMECVRAPTEI